MSRLFFTLQTRTVSVLLGRVVKSSVLPFLPSSYQHVPGVVVSLSSFGYYNTLLSGTPTRSLFGVVLVRLRFELAGEVRTSNLLFFFKPRCPLYV